MENRYEFEKRFKEQILKCSRCGFCQAVCPVYGATLRPALNARGKMLILKEVMEGKIDLTEDLVESLFQCTTCASCSINCPSGVEVPEILKIARKDLVKEDISHPAFKGMAKVLEQYSNIYGEDEEEDFGKQKGGRAENIFFIGCVGRYREDEATEANLELLDRLGVDYTLIEEACCGGVLEDVGYSINKRLVDYNIKTITETGARTLITGCPYCWRTFKNREEYAPLRDKGIEIVHISQFFSRYEFDVKTDKRVTYHDPCDLGRHSSIYDEPRETLTRITSDFVEMEHHHQNALCCGAGGGVRGAYPKNSIQMARRRLKEAEDTGAEIIITECNSCLHNLSNARLRKQKFRILNTAQFILELMDS